MGDKLLSSIYRRPYLESTGLIVLALWWSIQVHKSPSIAVPDSTTSPWFPRMEWMGGGNGWGAWVARPTDSEHVLTDDANRLAQIRTYAKRRTSRRTRRTTTSSATGRARSTSAWNRTWRRPTVRPRSTAPIRRAPPPTTTTSTPTTTTSTTATTTTTTTTTTKKKAEDDALSGRCIQLVDDDRAVDEDEAWEEEQVDARRAKRGRRGKPTTKRLVGDRENKRAKQKTDPLCNRVPITKRNTPRDILFGRSLWRNAQPGPVIGRARDFLHNNKAIP